MASCINLWYYTIFFSFRFDDFLYTMAEKMIQFKSKKEIFDKAATRLTCSICKVVCSTIQIFQTGQGDV